MQPSVTLDPQPHFAGDLQPASLRDSFRIQLRVIGALLMREVLTRYGRHNIGFMWLFAEPMIFTVGIAAIWSLLGITKAPDISIAAIALTGYSTILLWRNMPQRCIQALLPNGSLMYHRQVRPLDVYLARSLLEAIGATISFVVLAAVFTCLHMITPPEDYLTVLSGWALLTWFAMAVSLIIGPLSESFDIIDKLWHPFQYLLIPLSGAAFIVAALPPALQTAAMYNPIVHCVELLREGFFGSHHPWHYSVFYVTTINLILTLIALTQVRRIARRLTLNY